MRIQIQPGFMRRREFKVNGGRRETSAGRDPPRECPEFHHLQCLESIFILNWTLEEQEPNIQIRSFEEMRKCNLCKYGEIQDGRFDLKLNWRQRADGRLQKEETHHENVLNADLQPWKQRNKNGKLHPEQFKFFHSSEVPQERWNRIQPVQQYLVVNTVHS